MHKNALRLSIGANVFLICAAVFFIGKRWHFQHQLSQQLQQHAYLDNPQYREQVNIQGAYDRPATIVMLGNSHIYKAQWQDLLNRSDVTARGIGSDMTDGYLARLDQVLKVHPKIVFIEGGANDLYYERPVDSIIGNLTRLLNELDAEHILVVFHTLPPFASFATGADHYNAQLGELNAAILELCRRTGAPYIDLYRLFEDHGYLRPEYAQADGYHLTGAAYKLWAEEIQKKLREIPGN
ncbi:MAG TPA: GDSL-type esterase/lipase family protein [Puia sp.]|nr:GDSL-type esterase/lipase family protein [Puia sp.]